MLDYIDAVKSVNFILLFKIVVLQIQEKTRVQNVLFVKEDMVDLIKLMCLLKEKKEMILNKLNLTKINMKMFIKE